MSRLRSSSPYLVLGVAFVATVATVLTVLPGRSPPPAQAVAPSPSPCRLGDGDPQQTLAGSLEGDLDFSITEPITTSGGNLYQGSCRRR